MRVLRVPAEKVGIEDAWAYQEAHEEDFPALSDRPHFSVAPTVRPFIDYVLFERVSEKNSYGRTRALSLFERRKYGPVFRRLFPDIDMRDVRYVAFCFYDGCEAPDYYEKDSDA